MTNSQKDKKRDDVLKRMLDTPPDPRKAKKDNKKQGDARRHHARSR